MSVHISINGTGERSAWAAVAAERDHVVVEIETNDGDVRAHVRLDPEGAVMLATRLLQARDEIRVSRATSAPPAKT